MDYNTYSQQFYKPILSNFSEILKIRKFSRGELIQPEGKVYPNLYFIQSGILRAFYFKEDKDITAHFAFKYESITAPDSFILNKPSKYNIEALEDSEVYIVDQSDLEVYLDKNSSLEKLARKFTQSIYIELLMRLEGLVFLSAKERYDNLLSRDSQLPLKVNLGHIASYLGITQETLSRIRSK